ncbi:DUF3237 domain-containing protein [Paraburkholderia tropica]|uniref:DUF3237 domain-containing protein n=1 Tax=Paraburkholderia tropica TaxID=92647 RepID=UPI0007EDD22F|nr:DUF3237 domain-containing protein [Paraburkholderia tropica]
MTGTSLKTEWVMRIEVCCGEPQIIGPTHGGQRINFPILSGRVDGTNLSGVVLPGGSDFYIERADGVGVLDARYTLQTHTGVLVNVLNRGMLVVDSDVAPGTWPLPPSRYRCRCTPEFDAPAGELAWMNQNVFAGAIGYPERGRVVVDIWRLA